MSMHDAEFEQRLAEYLGGEMSAAQRAALEAELASDAERAGLLREMSALQRLLAAPAATQPMTPRLAVERSRAAHRRGVRWGTVLAQAAAVGLTFAGGYLTRDAQSPDAAASSGVVSATDVDRLQDRLQAAQRANPGGSRLATALLAFARD